MMKRRFEAGIALALMVGTCVAATAHAPLQLFGVTLKGASRTQLRQVFTAHGMKALREDDRYWVDEYNPSGALSGAGEFDAVYVKATGRFAAAEYTFSSFMDADQVTRVIALVQSKYGAPSSMSGNTGLGPVTARWNLPDGMQIKVSRGWPETTTFLDYIDTAADRTANAEMNAERQAELKSKSKQENSAF